MKLTLKEGEKTKKSVNKILSNAGNYVLIDKELAIIK